MLNTLVFRERVVFESQYICTDRQVENQNLRCCKINTLINVIGMPLDISETFDTKIELKNTN